MKNSIIWILCFIPLLCFADVNGDIQALKSQLQSVNQERKSAREKADQIFIEYEKGAIDEDEIDDEYRVLESHIKTLNSQKQVIETRIKKLEAQEENRLINRSIPTPIEIKSEVIPPPSGVTSSIGGMIADSMINFGRFFIGAIVLMVIIFCIAFAHEMHKTKKQATVSQDVPQFRPLHSGRIPPHLL